VLALVIAGVGLLGTAVEAAPSKERTMNLAFVLLSKPHLPKPEEIARAFGRFAASKDQALRPRPATGEARSKTDVVELELSSGGMVLVALMPAAVPKGEADDAARFSVSSLGSGWKLPPHAAHLVVTLREASALSATEALSRFTSVLAAVTDVSAAVGVYWGNAGATHDPKFFIAAAQRHEVASRIMLWTGVSVAREADGRVSLLSTGMKQLSLPDLLLVAPKSAGTTALSTFFDLLTYVTELGKPLPEGDTVGRTADERLPVHYVKSPLDPNVKVWRVELK